jgi:hypothetical protein
VGIFRYIVQGIGWEIGSQAAKEGIQATKEHLDERDAAQAAPLTEREKAKLAKLEAKQAAAAKAEREAAIAKKKADIEAQLTELKKKA